MEVEVEESGGKGVFPKHIGGLDEMEVEETGGKGVFPKHIGDLDEMEVEGIADSEDAEGKGEGSGATTTEKGEASRAPKRLDEEAERDRDKDWQYLQYEDALSFRDDWTSVWGGKFGSFEDTTAIQPMRFTDIKPPPGYAHPLDSLQIYSVNVAEIRGGLHWPIDVYGMIAMRDIVDRNRNIIFNRSRDNCQTLTKKDSCLVLTGPTRPIVMLGPSTFEIVLKVKESTEYGDKDLSFLAIPHANATALELSCPTNRKYTSKLSTLEFTMSQIVCSVEATISVQVVDGSWPDGFRGEFTACTTSMADKEVILLDSGSEKVPVNADGMVQLSRCIASVELAGELKVSVEAWQGEDAATKPKKAGKVFKPKKAGRNSGTFNLGFCKMKVTVAWSLLSYYPVNHLGSLNWLPTLL